MFFSTEIGLLADGVSLLLFVVIYTNLTIFSVFTKTGSDLFNVTTASGHRQMIIVETNSCPSGQKSMPLLSESDVRGCRITELDTRVVAVVGTPVFQVLFFPHN